MHRISLVTTVVLGIISLGVGGNTVIENQTSTQLAVTQEIAVADDATEDNDPIVPPNLRMNGDSVI